MTPASAMTFLIFLQESQTSMSCSKPGKIQDESTLLVAYAFFFSNVGVQKAMGPRIGARTIPESSVAEGSKLCFYIEKQSRRSLFR